ncbi:MAG: Assymetric_cell_division_FstX [uncultured Acidimicrobiales bacterium]|uniref:Cell division protein FtsX n=1 Tax=uncultured Acidimicrobiales bacterium TaxID=310071 RepID=A0A6J4IVY6_9ACTN|nr:MAG: Assymetric_cell_division_FstX [uncultured Acidimicrobiales bacterium]
MAVSASYVARETATNLSRNGLMSVAAIVTIAVGLLFFGSAIMWQQGVDRQTARWRGGIELSVFMQPSAADQQVDAVNKELDSAPEVKKATFVDKAAAYSEMKELFASQPEVVEAVGEQDAPPSFRVVPNKAEQVEDVGARFKDKPGVLSVVYAKETVDVLIKSTAKKRNLSLGVAFLAGASALLVILNTVRMAIFSRRREVAIMKLVGATNWFIRVPFMLEGMVQGIIGAAAAFLLIFVARDQIMSFVNDAAINQFTNLYATTGEVVKTGILLLLVGAGMGAVSSAIAVRRFLDV